MITIADLRRIKPIINLAEVARRAGIQEQALFARVRRGSELSVTDSQRIGDALRSVGLHYEREGSDND